MNSTFNSRWLNIVLGAWLFVSAFAWQHSIAQFDNAWIVGIAMALTAAVAMRFTEVRYLNAALAVWLFISGWALPVFQAGTFWNNLVVSVVVFIAALVPRAPQAPRMIGTHTPEHPVGAHR